MPQQKKRMQIIIKSRWWYNVLFYKLLQQSNVVSFDMMPFFVSLTMTQPSCILQFGNYNQVIQYLI